MRPVDGFAASSLFEARLAREVIGDAGRSTSRRPGLRDGELPELGELCDHVTFNSLSQLRRLAADARQARPSRPARQSRALAGRRRPLRSLPAALQAGRAARAARQELAPSPALFEQVAGCCSTPIATRRASSRCTRPSAPRVEAGRSAPELRWINLGGGYLLDAPARSTCSPKRSSRCDRVMASSVYIEPGAALVRKAGYLVASVIDLFRSGGKTIAVLDTTINHVPEVFEYQFEPDVLGHDDDGEYEYLLAGSSCLAGDLMGDYAFERRLRIGSRVVLSNVGAYAIVKAHMFNGINLPSIYSVTADGRAVAPPALYLRRFCLSLRGLPRCGCMSTSGRFPGRSDTGHRRPPRPFRARRPRRSSARRAPRSVRRLRRQPRPRCHCEVGILSTGLDSSSPASPPIPSIFEFRKRPFESTEAFNVVFLVPTGINATIGGHAGDAGPVARLLASVCDTLITHPNVVNASDINEMPENCALRRGKRHLPAPDGDGRPAARAEQPRAGGDRPARRDRLLECRDQRGQRGPGLLRLRLPADRHARPAGQARLGVHLDGPRRRPRRQSAGLPRRRSTLSRPKPTPSPSRRSSPFRPNSIRITSTATAPWSIPGGASRPSSRTRSRSCTGCPRPIRR